MSRFTFSDGPDICVYNNGEVKKYSSAYIESYKQNLESIARSKSWKKSGTGAIFRGDEDYDMSDGRKGEGELKAEISGVYPTENENEVIYSFKVNGTSGIYKKELSDEAVPETHVINSHELTFNGGCLNAQSGVLATSLKRNYCNADIAIFDINSGDYKTVTDGDTLDEDPCICSDNENIIYYSSRGVGRSSSGEFVCFSPAAIYKLDLGKVDVEEVISSDKYSYYKPVPYGDKLYAIKAPSKVKKGNPIIEIILIPWRILEALANFINLLVHAFSGKSITEGGYNPAKGKDYDGKQIEVKGNMINVEKTKKENASKKDSDYGYVPNSWQLIEVHSGEVLKNGIADFDVCEDGTIIATNGRRIFEIKNGTVKKLCNAQCCMRVNALHRANKNNNLFGF